MRSGQIHDLPNTERREKNGSLQARGFLLNNDEDCLKGEQAAGCTPWGKESQAGVRPCLSRPRLELGGRHRFEKHRYKGEFFELSDRLRSPGTE